MGRTKFFDGDILKVEGIGWWDHPTILPSGWPHWGSFHSKVGQCQCLEKLSRGHRSKWLVLKSVRMCWFVLGYEFETHLKKPKEWIDPRTTCLDLWKRPLFAFHVTMLKLHELTGWLCSHLTGYSRALGEPLWFPTLDFGPINSEKTKCEGHLLHFTSFRFLMMPATSPKIDGKNIWLQAFQDLSDVRSLSLLEGVEVELRVVLVVFVEALGLLSYRWFLINMYPSRKKVWMHGSGRSV